MPLIWERADLSRWGEFIDTPLGQYRKTWEYTDAAQNVDGCLFSLWFDGNVLAKGIDGPTITDAEDLVDILVKKHQAEMVSPMLT